MAKGSGENMTTEPVLSVSDVHLAYRRSRHRITSLKQTAIDTVKRRIEFEKFYALNGVSMQVNAGETVAVIGKNGAGKSTLMKVVARILPPTSGRVVVRGSVAPMIELGAGFNPELTGAENVLLYGTLLGRTPQVMKTRIEAIADWAGLHDFMDVPLRTYSSGMIGRLAFSIATDTTPDLLLIDEVLSTGDQDFQEKSSARMKTLLNSGAAVLLVTHNLAVVKDLASRAIYLDRGIQKASGDPEEVIAQYLAEMHN